MQSVHTQIVKATACTNIASCNTIIVWWWWWWCWWWCWWWWWWWWCWWWWWWWWCWWWWWWWWWCWWWWWWWWRKQRCYSYLNLFDFYLITMIWHLVHTFLTILAQDSAESEMSRAQHLMGIARSGGGVEFSWTCLVFKLFPPLFWVPSEICLRNKERKLITIHKDVKHRYAWYHTWMCP